VSDSAANLNPLALVFLILMAGLTFCLQRRWAILPLLITTCYIPLGQKFVIAGASFEFFRMLLLVGICRASAKSEWTGLRISRIDKVFLYWTAVTLVVGTLTEPSLERFVSKVGEVYNAFATFFLVRCWIRNLDEMLSLVKSLALIIVPLAISMLLERTSGRNMFSALGGVPEMTYVRDGKVRCQGAFRHAILAGTYGATCFPLFVGLWTTDKRRATIGIAAALVVTVTASSSGALLALVSGVIGFALWPLKRYMSLFRKLSVILLIAAAILMKSPVWYLIARVSEITGGTGWYRSFLIDQAVNHFNEWWLVGSNFTAHWAPGGEIPVGNPNNTDIVNHYVAEGLGGGVWKLGLFIAIIVLGFKTVGKLVRQPGYSKNTRLLIWSFGVTLAAHCVSFVSVSYFDQIIIMWYWLLAILSVLSLVKSTAFSPFLQPSPQPQECSQDQEIPGFIVKRDPDAFATC
jgi:hypothetical protein